MTVRIVVDTSVFISALISSNGASRELLRQCLQGKYQPLMGNALFCEYEQVIGREEILHLCPLTAEEIQVLTSAFMSVCEWTRIYYLWRPNLKDEADNHLIELAVAGNAQFVATNNTKDFRQTELIFPEVLIKKPSEIINL
ncbi:putative toxin-antitoxin system toxin component, PIN family [Chroococcidiopsis sp. CCNUC1]|uniref:putative toxin-antitoxin system toxin component, PIN family n=1 Tax=Chroococcidiopsis sp. CCNUC1 TaxID=2653189 RepID=UPI0020227FC5|nr:putative toxin-antitoxin system toxin component, PIN family [Chroococcidiopsis sp. CCNUC1]URD53544.1 putative toxin-antitoxin system toxin component, PIN family [Chroococcidiopsis sp. CCNUC1]